MKKVRKLPPIEYAGHRDFVASTVQKIADDVLDATKLARSIIKRFKTSGDAELIAEAMDHLTRELKRLCEEAVFVKRAVGLSESQDRSRVGKKTYIATQMRQWEQWRTEVHEQSLCDPSRAFVESERDQDTVYWRGKRIGYVSTYGVYASEDAKEPISMGYYVTNPFKIAYKKPYYETHDEAVGRLIDEASSFVTCPPGALEE